MRIISEAETVRALVIEYIEDVLRQGKAWVINPLEVVNRNFWNDCVTESGAIGKAIEPKSG